MKHIISKAPLGFGLWPLGYLMEVTCLAKQRSILSKILSQVLLVVALLTIWELVARSRIYPELLFPPVGKIAAAFHTDAAEMLKRTWTSVYAILIGLGLAIGIAVVAASVSMLSRTVGEAMVGLMAIMHPLPGIAVLPIIILWLGSGSQSIIALITFSAVWPLIANIHAGLRAVPPIQMEVGRNLGLRGIKLVWSIMIPASLPYILTGLRVAWARSWQASVAAEMVFGAAGGQGGLGWYLYKKRFFMEIPAVFAGMTIIIALGMAIEYVLFNGLETVTIRRWRMTVD